MQCKSRVGFNGLPYSVTFPCCRYDRTTFGFACGRTRGAWIQLCDTSMQYGFLLDSCDVILLCIVSQISNKTAHRTWPSARWLDEHKRGRCVSDASAKHTWLPVSLWPLARTSHRRHSSLASWRQIDWRDQHALHTDCTPAQRRSSHLHVADRQFSHSVTSVHVTSHDTQ